jgi:diguanylate cyclase (GGDEF)-like protein
VGSRLTCGLLTPRLTSGDSVEGNLGMRRGHLRSSAVAQKRLARREVSLPTEQPKSASASGPGRIPARVWGLVGAMAAVAAGLSWLTVTHGDHLDSPYWLPWLTLVPALVVAERHPVTFGAENNIQLNLFAIPMVVGGAFMAPANLILAVGVSAVTGAIVGRDVPIKAAFNLASHLAGAALSRLALGVILAGHAPVGWRGLLALAAASAIFEVFTTVAASLAVATAGGRRALGRLRGAVLQMALVVPLDATMAVIAVTVASVERWGLLLLIGPAAALALWYRSSARTRDRYSNLQKLYRFMATVAEMTETEEIVVVALERVKEMFRCRDAELLLPAELGGVRCRLDEEGRLLRGLEPASPLERTVVSSRQGVRLARPGGWRRFGAGESEGETMAALVPVGTVGQGVVVVRDPVLQAESFDDEDLRFLEALGASLGSALVSSDRLDQLRQEVAARRHQALHDSLTGLANRILFGRWLDQTLSRRRPNQQVAVLVMDLDGFKDINDTLGHQSGDALLKEVGARVLGTIGSTGLSARLGGDEFAFVLADAGSVANAVDTARRLLEAVCQPVVVDGLTLEVGASVGVAVAPDHGSDADTLLRRADLAMYAAKQSRRGALAYSRDIDHTGRRKLVLANDLRQAVERGELRLWYQPVARLDDTKVCSMEALLRWTHPRHGAVSPVDFIPVAEQSGLIETITYWVLETALAQLSAWKREGYDLRMAVNLSPRSLLSHEIVRSLQRILAKSGVDPASLVLEVTESLRMTDPEVSEIVLRALADLGVGIAIDDFGTGYSSLARLRSLPVSCLKVDRTFVMKMHLDPGDAAIVKATVDLAKSMGLVVVAEGVELAETWQRLVKMGCDQAQGNLLAAAMPAEDCEAWLKAHQAPGMAPVRPLPRLARGA